MQHRGAPPVDNVTCVHQGPWPVANAPQEVNHQEASPLREVGQESWTLKAGPHPAHNQAAVSGIEGFFPLDSSSVYEEEEETLCLVSVYRMGGSKRNADHALNNPFQDSLIAGFIAY